VTDTTDRKAEDELGRDEMNLAEFPVALIGKRPPGNVKTLRFTDRVFDRSRGDYVTRTLIVTGSDLWGLPSQFDDEVLFACIQLTNEQEFRNPKVEFTRYELLNILGRPPDGRNYQRVSESLDRWAGTLIISDKAFWDKESKSWVKDTFTLIDRVNLVDKETVRQRRGSNQPNGQKSWFIWGDFMWRSFQSGNLREIDFEFWKSLRHSISKRLYRILGKRFWFGPQVRFDLHTLAYEKIGMSRNMHTGQIREKLRPANEELHKRGVCRGEFVRRERGRWDVVYKQHNCNADLDENRADSALLEQLRQRGVAKKASLRLVGQFSKERIEEKIRIFDWHAVQGKAKDPGFLVAAIEENYEMPKRMRSKESDNTKKVVAQRNPAKPQTSEQLDSQNELAKRISLLSESELSELVARALRKQRLLFTNEYERYRLEDAEKYEELRRYLIESELESSG
jgi:hypothetical protein